MKIGLYAMTAFGILFVWFIAAFMFAAGGGTGGPESMVSLFRLLHTFVIFIGVGSAFYVAKNQVARELYVLLCMICLVTIWVPNIFFAMDTAPWEKLDGERILRWIGVIGFSVGIFRSVYATLTEIEGLHESK